MDGDLRRHTPTDDGLQRGFAAIWHQFHVNLAMPFEQTLPKGRPQVSYRLRHELSYHAPGALQSNIHLLPLRHKSKPLLRWLAGHGQSSALLA